MPPCFSKCRCTQCIRMCDSVPCARCKCKQRRARRRCKEPGVEQGLPLRLAHARQPLLRDHCGNGTGHMSEEGGAYDHAFLRKIHGVASQPTGANYRPLATQPCNMRQVSPRTHQRVKWRPVHRTARPRVPAAVRWAVLRVMRMTATSAPARRASLQALEAAALSRSRQARRDWRLSLQSLHLCE